MVRMVDGRLALRKADSEPAFVRHEGEILEALRDVPCVPELLHRTNRAIYVDYIEGLPLLERSAAASMVESLRLGVRVLGCIAAVHDRGVVHSDIRHWNFIESRDGHLYLIDFEYAYVRTRKTQPSLLAVHHTLGLRPSLADWADGLQCVGTLWHASASRFLRWAMSPVVFSVSLMIRLVLRPRELYRRARRWQARRRSPSDARHD